MKFNLKDHDLNANSIKTWDLAGSTNYVNIK